LLLLREMHFFQRLEAAPDRIPGLTEDG